MNNANQSEVAKLFKRLAKDYPAVAEPVIAYVSGADPAALMTLPTGAGAAIEECCTRRWSADTDALTQVMRDPGRLTGDQWVRVGQVFALADEMKNKSRPPVVPDWLLALQLALRNADAGNYVMVSDEALIWDVTFLATVLASAGVAPDTQPVTVFATLFNSLDASYPDPVDGWAKATEQSAVNQARLQAFVTYVQANAGQVPQALTGASAANKAQTARWLKLFPQLVPPLAPMLAEWAVASAKTVREASVTLVAGLDEPLRSQILASALDQGTAATLGTLINQTVHMGEAGRVLLQGGLGSGGKKDELLQAALTLNDTVAAAPENTIDLPPVPPLDTTSLGDEFTDRLQAGIEKWAAEQRETLAKGGNDEWTRKWARERLATAAKMDRAFCERLRAWLNGDGDRPKHVEDIPTGTMKGLKLPFLAAVRFSVEPYDDKKAQLQLWQLNVLGVGDYDLRLLAQAATQAGATDAASEIGEWVLGWGGLRTSAENTWPFFAEHPG